MNTPKVTLWPEYNPLFVVPHNLWDGLHSQENGVCQDEGDDEIFEWVGLGEPAGEVPHRVKHVLESATSHNT